MNIDANTIITAISSLVAAGIGAWALIVTARKGRVEDELKEVAKELGAAAGQVAAYHALEQELATDLARFRNCGVRTIKTEYRDRVVAKGYPRPKWTEMQARIAQEIAFEAGGK